jgi:Zn-dependent peptidase ImmA (M78 family)/DNA-binding XRE family transcriptional regulator
MSENSAIPGNLARLRAERGLTQAKLAAKSNMSRLALGKIERDEVEPRAETLAKLAKALNVPLREIVASVESLSGVRFRARKRVNTRQQILAEVASWLSAYSWLESALDSIEPFELEALVGCRLPPVELAVEARNLLGLDKKEAVRDVCGLLEDNGVKLLLLNKKTDAFFGLSVAPNGGGPAVVVNTWARISVERWIFTAAHELGHILLHQEAYDRGSSEEREQEEREADRFASQFLMPEPGFASEWDQTRGLPLILRVLKVKRMFRVSYKTVLHRLVDSGREPKAVWKDFQVQHKQQYGSTLRKVDEPKKLEQGEFRLNWSRAGEPDGLSETDFVEDRLSRLVRVALEKGVISLGRAAEILNISRKEMRELSKSWGR